MPFIEKIKQIATGKSEIERKQEAAATQIIRRKALAAQLKERERQSIRLATERERISADQRLKKMKEPPKQYFSPISSGWGRSSGMVNILGRQPAQPQTQRVKRIVRITPKKRKARTRTRIVYVNRPRKRKARTKTVYVNRPRIPQPAPYRVI